MELHRLVGLSLPVSADRRARTRGALGAMWVATSVVALILLEAVQDEVGYGLGVVALAGGATVASARLFPAVRWLAVEIDARDLAFVAALYAAVVGLFVAAFQGFTTNQTAGLFIFFGAGLVLGVAGPIAYTVHRGRPLASLGLGLRNLRATLALGVLLAGVQFALTLYGYALPSEGVDWVPLLGMSLVVGLFESVFFRGFIQTRLEASFGIAGGVAGAAVLYALYHVGYGMGAREMTFLLGLGVVYGVAFRLVGNLLVLWPLLTPLGSFYANLEAGDIDLPWASLLGFADVLALMAIAVFVGRRRQFAKRRSADHTRVDRGNRSTLSRQGRPGVESDILSRASNRKPRIAAESSGFAAVTQPPNGDRYVPFELDLIPERDRIIVAPRGEIDIATVGQVRTRLDELQLAGFDQIVLDLRNVTFLDSTGLRLIIHEAQKEGVDFAVIPGDEAVQRVFEVTGLVGMVPFVER